VDIPRDAAQEAARQELSDPIYHQSDANPLTRAVSWAIERIGELLDRISLATPGGWGSLAVLLVLVLLGVIAIRLRLGPLARTASRSRPPLFSGSVRDAAEHRATADRHAADGRYREAIREMLRAIIRDLEERGILDVLPGRTADEAAAEAGRHLPGCALALRDAARVFDEVWYGGHEATAEMYQAVSALDRRVATTSPVRDGDGQVTR